MARRPNPDKWISTVDYNAAILLSSNLPEHNVPTGEALQLSSWRNEQNNGNLNKIQFTKREWR